jgi:quercetin dioxygenase-like cupin family protein
MRTIAFDDHRDLRGYVVNPFEGNGDTGEIARCHAFSIAPGCVRGNHSHQDRNEKVLLLAGSVEFRYGAEKQVFSAPAFLEFDPGEHHSFLGKGGTPAALICWSDRFVEESS